MNTEDYYGKLDEIVNDKSKFAELKEEEGIKAIIQKETSITYYNKKYMKKVEGYAKLIPSGSKPGKLYGKAKVHKSNVPLRPIVSMVDTPEYSLAKYLDNVIKSYIPDTHLLRSTEDFLERLKQFPCNDKCVLVSFDVVSLFTNVPLSKTIDLITNYLYVNENANNISLPKEVFRELMCMTTQGIFMHNGKFYKQLDEISMGSPLGSTLANFFVGQFRQENI